MCIWFLISGTSSIVICHWSYCHIFFLRPTSLDSRKHHIFFLNAKGQTVSHCNPAGVRWFFIQASIASWVGWGGRQIYMLCHLVSTWQCIAGRNVVLSRFNLIEKKTWSNLRLKFEMNHVGMNGMVRSWQSRVLMDSLCIQILLFFDWSFNHFLNYLILDVWGLTMTTDPFQ